MNTGIGKNIFLLICLFCVVSRGTSQNDYSFYVNPFIGASTSTHKAGAYHGLGKTFPGATTPFGMVQVSPNTITGGDNGSGYSYEHETIEGFAFTQMSGVGWFGDLGNFLVMPTIGKLYTNSGKEGGIKGYRSYYDKTTEVARAGYYKVVLSDSQILVEATAAPHSGMLRFTFPENARSRIQIDLARRVGGTSTFQEFRKVDDFTITGKMCCTPDGGGWGNGAGKADYIVYFYAQFSKPLKTFGVWDALVPNEQVRKLKWAGSQDLQDLASEANVVMSPDFYAGKHIGFFTEFSTFENEQVLMKTGISFVSEDGARKNLESEINNWDFDALQSKTVDLWNQNLSKIQISGGTYDEKVTFYTALYHTMIDPRILSDVDGNYPGPGQKVYYSEDFTKRTIFSGWDVFRSQMPLQTIINPDLINDVLSSLLTLAEQSGKHYFERWEFFNAYSGCMLGNPAISVLTDAYVKGIIPQLDIEKAYQYADTTSQLFGNVKYGYTPNPAGVSKTLEYAYTEWCMYCLAKALGKDEDAQKYFNLSLSYENIYDPDKKTFRPRDTEGVFIAWPSKGKLQGWYGCIESNLLQQEWFVPHNITGLIKLKGGEDNLILELDSMFASTPTHLLWNPYYNHANEVVHHIPFLYNRLGQPWKTQYWVRHICKNAYLNKVEGLVGNEDVGQMSAWYVLASCGLYPICPGDTRYEITSPTFSEISIRLDNGNMFTIKATGNSKENVYIQSAKLNNKTYPYCYLDYSDIMKGGKLELEMGDSPNKDWGIQKK